MKILFICNEYPPGVHGGIGSFIKNIAEFLSAQNHDITVIGYGAVEGKYEEVINGVRVIRLENGRRRRFLLSRIISEILERYILFKAVSNLIIKFKPDLIETYDWSAP